MGEWILKKILIKTIFSKVNTKQVKANWKIGRHIVEFEQHGDQPAEYGNDLLTKLSVDLKSRYGKGFGRRNVLDMQQVEFQTK